MVFAAGPAGLYVFDFAGTLFGRIMFDDPVTGVATGNDQVYLVVGHILCALTFDDAFSSHPNTTKVSAVTPVTNVLDPTVKQPAATSRQPTPSSNKSAPGRHLDQEQTNPKSSHQLRARLCERKRKSSSKGHRCRCNEAGRGS